MNINEFILHTVAVVTLFTQQTLFPHAFPKDTMKNKSTVNQKMIHASTDISQYGKTVHLDAQFPKDGGSMKGTISGDCDGTVSGIYSGESKGKTLTGTATASCPVAIFSINVTIDFNGTVNEKDTQAKLSYSAKAQGNTKTGSTTLTLSEK